MKHLLKSVAKFLLTLMGIGSGFMFVKSLTDTLLTYAIHTHNHTYWANSYCPPVTSFSAKFNSGENMIPLKLMELHLWLMCIWESKSMPDWVLRQQNHLKFEKSLLIIIIQLHFKSAKISSMANRSKEWCNAQAARQQKHLTHINLAEPVVRSLWWSWLSFLFCC